MLLVQPEIPIVIRSRLQRRKSITPNQFPAGEKGKPTNQIEKLEDTFMKQEGVLSIKKVISGTGAKDAKELPILPV